MKKLVLLLVAIVLFSCNTEPKDYVSIKGTVSNPNMESMTLLGKNFKKDIKVAEDGTFSDTLKVNDDFHVLRIDNNQSFLYLKNGYDLAMNFDTKDFPNSVVFKGQGSGTNMYLKEKLDYIKEAKIDKFQVYFELEEEEFEAKVKEISKSLDDLIANADDLEPKVSEMEAESNKKLIEFLTTNYKKEHSSMATLKKGAPSPKFNYPNTNGKSVSLDDFKGKYVYVDVWATWCGPCKREIPHLKKLDAEYKNKNVVFVSMSIDKAEHKDKWLEMVKNENLKGVQIMADKDWNSDFVTAYGIKGIPRFILIDTEGNIVNANAPRPSDPSLKELFNSLNI